MNSSIWYKEIMSIKIPNLVHKDLSKILLIYYLIKENGFNKKIKILDLNRFIYRFYIDNIEFAKLHPSIIVNSLCHYGVKDLMPFTKQALEEWKNDYKNGCLNYDEQYFWVTIEDYNEKVLAYTKKITDMLFLKSTNHQFDYDDEIEKFNDYDLEIINESRMKNRVLEDMQYCVCCDDIGDLKLINISNDIKYINIKENYLTVCINHYNLFKDKYFNINSTGYLNIIKVHPLINKKMHISNYIINEKRKEILDSLEEE